MSKNRFVRHLEDLILAEDYAGDPGGRRIRLRIRSTEFGVEILGDAMSPAELESLLDSLDAPEVEQMLCG
jgi:hypothetical protein